MRGRGRGDGIRKRRGIEEIRKRSGRGEKYEKTKTKRRNTKKKRKRRNTKEEKEKEENKKERHLSIYEGRRMKQEGKSQALGKTPPIFRFIFPGTDTNMRRWRRLIRRHAAKDR